MYGWDLFTRASVSKCLSSTRNYKYEQERKVFVPVHIYNSLSSGNYVLELYDQFYALPLLPLVSVLVLFLNRKP